MASQPYLSLDDPSSIDKINNDILEELICNIAYFFKGSVQMEWLEKQPISKLLRLQTHASKINSDIKRELNKSK